MLGYYGVYRERLGNQLDKAIPSGGKRRTVGFGLLPHEIAALNSKSVSK
jgi:hypothetical protein